MATTTIARTAGLAQFNKLNKAFITVLGMVDDQSLLNHDQYLYAEVNMDTEHEKIIGNYDNFEIVLISEQPLEVFEAYLNLLAREKIVSVYPLEKQLTIIGSLLEQLADASGVSCEDLKDMNDYIAEVRRANAVRKEFYDANPDYQYISTEKFEELYAEKYAGGISDYDPTATSF